MPRSLLEILLEKKDPKKSLPYPTRDQFNMALDALITICDSTLSGLKGVEDFGGVKSFGTIRDELKACRSTLTKYKVEWKDYPWNDPTVQEGVVDTRKKISGDSPGKIGGLLLDLEKARIDSLGEGDSYRIANTYFETAESLRVSGTQKILKIASMRYKELKVDRAKANTDLTQNNEFNKDKLDITAKKVPDRVTPTVKPTGMSEDDWVKFKETIKNDNVKIAEDNKKRKEEVAKVRMGMFYYLGMIVGETQDEVKRKWGGGDDGETEDPDPVKLKDQQKYRKELLIKAMPFIERVTQKDFDETNPLKDKEYIDYIMILGSYTPGYKNYKPDPKDKEVKEEITPEQYAVIAEDIGEKQKEIKALIIAIKERHKTSSLIDKTITDEMEKAQKELDSVEAKTACDVGSRKQLRDAREDLRQKIKDNKSVLKTEDITDLNKVADVIEYIFDYCDSKKYVKEVKK